jgi:hypothetical protein
MTVDIVRLRAAMRRDRRALLARFDAHGVGVVRAGDGWALRVYRRAPGPALPATVDLADDRGGFTVPVVEHVGPPMSEE